MKQSALTAAIRSAVGVSLIMGAVIPAFAQDAKDDTIEEEETDTP